MIMKINFQGRKSLIMKIINQGRIQDFERGGGTPSPGSAPVSNVMGVMVMMYSVPMVSLATWAWDLRPV